MEMMEQIVQLISNFGVTVAMLVYFAWRDNKYMSKIDSTLDVILKFIEKEDKN